MVIGLEDARKNAEWSMNGTQKMACALEISLMSIAVMSINC